MCYTKLKFSYHEIEQHEVSAKDILKNKNEDSKDDESPERPSLKNLTPLPKNGTCKHYKKSFRWLRFPCCAKMYPCEECHEN